MKKALLKVLNVNQDSAYSDPKSVLKEYDIFLAINGIYRSNDIESYRKKIRKKTELCDEIITLYKKATLENERILLLEDLFAIGYDSDKLVVMILAVFSYKNRPANLWEYGDLLYTIRNFRYLTQYIKIIEDYTLGDDRQMVILLVGKSREEKVIPILTSLLDDSTVYGHALEALSCFSGEEIDRIMIKYMNCSVKWISRIAQGYMAKYRK